MFHDEERFTFQGFTFRELEQFQSWCIPMFSESVIPTEAPSACGRSSPGCVPDAALDKQEAVRARSGGILCLLLSSYGKATTRFLDSRRKASLARNDAHLAGYSISGFDLEKIFHVSLFAFPEARTSLKPWNL